jgi:hypothetical protein
VAVIGQAAAAPPSSVMNARRLGDCPGIAEVVLLSSRVGTPHIWLASAERRDQAMLRLKWCAPTQASMPIRHGGRLACGRLI